MKPRVQLFQTKYFVYSVYTDANGIVGTLSMAI